VLNVKFLVKYFVSRFGCFAFVVLQLIHKCHTVGLLLYSFISIIMNIKTIK